jgi:tetratricopeptide (TPR) repeat protein
MIEIFNALAADSLEKISCHKDHVKATIEFVKKAENIHALTPYTWIIKGFYELRQGDIRRAEDHFKNVSRQSPQYSFAAHVGLGITSFFRQKYAQALENFTKAITCHPGCNSTLRIAFAVCAFKLEQYERARAASEKAILMDSQSTKALVMLALLEMVSAQRDTSCRKEKRRNAFEYCILALQLDSSCSQALNVIANHYFHTWQVAGDGNHRAGTSQIIVSGAAHLSIQELDPLQLNGSFLCRVKDVRSVDSDDVLITLNVDLPEDLKKIKFSVETKAYGQVRHLAQRALESSDLPKVKAESLYFLGRLSHVREEYSTALGFYGRALQFAPELSLAAFGTGQLLLAQGRYREAEINFRNVLSINPEDKDTQAYLLLLHSFLQQELFAFDKIREVSVGFPYEVDLWLIQAQLRFVNAIELPTCLRMLETAISSLEKQGLHVFTELYLNLSVVHNLVGNKEKAYSFSRKGLSQLLSITGTKSRGWSFKCAENDDFWTWSDNFTAIFNLSENSYVVHDHQTQLFLSQEVVEGDEFVINDSFVLTLTRLLKDGSGFCGCSFITVPDGTSVSCKRKVPRVAFNDDNLCYFFNHARILEGMGFDCAAEELYCAILNSHPSFIDCYLRLGQISLKKGNFDFACSWLVKALNIDGDNIDANITLGDFYVSKSKWVEAKASYEKANGRTEGTQDSRAMVSLGNMYLANLGTNREDNLKLSYKFYHHVLNKDNLNIFAAVGLGMVCSEKKLFEVARDIFSRVKPQYLSHIVFFKILIHLYL